MLLILADGSYDTLNFWRELPERTVLAVRTARNRRLYYLSERHAGPGRPASYGLAPHPCDWLHKGIAWQKREVPVRGKAILMKFQVLGPFVREGLPEVPLFLFVVKGMHRKVGKKRPITNIASLLFTSSRLFKSTAHGSCLYPWKPFSPGSGRDENSKSLIVK